MLSPEDKIETLLKKYSDLAEAEHAELFWKPPIAERRLFICGYCGKIKQSSAIEFRFHRLDKTVICFCSRKCWGQFLKRNYTVRWTENRKIYKYAKNPIETTPDLTALSLEQKRQNAMKKYCDSHKDQIKARNRLRYKKKPSNSQTSA